MWKALAAALLAGLICVQPTLAQDGYPAKPVRRIIPFPAGSAVDSVGRLIAARWSAEWKQPVVIDHVPGASGTIGLAKRAKSAPAPAEAKGT